MVTVINKDTQTIVLSSFTRILKTERFIADTARFLKVDELISQLAEGLILNEEIFNENNGSAFILCTKEENHTFYICIGKGLNNRSVSEKDIIFYAYEDKGNKKIKNDSSFLPLIESKTIEFSIKPTGMPQAKDFNKLYSIFNSDSVNFPLLSPDQLKIIETENKNLLVQGVAGSGKTNVCIDKIIYSACREYAGKVLYTTFSRGLLTDTKDKLDLFKKNILSFAEKLKSNKVIFTDSHHKKAVENKLGVFFNVEDEEIYSKILRIAKFLDEKVDFMLIRDFNKGMPFADEDFFYHKFIQSAKSNKFIYSKLQRLKSVSIEIIYKEIYGYILGKADPQNPFKEITLDEYVNKRTDFLTKTEREVIYQLSLDYKKFLAQYNAVDNNSISRSVLKNTTAPLYSLSVVDEVQDLTEVNLCMIKAISRKVFAVGDALQMINPSYFSFAYLKRLLYEKEVAAIELKNNYRNTAKINDAINDLSDLNVGRFGNHSFVLKGKSVEEAGKTQTVYIRDKDFARLTAKEKPDNFTVVVSSLTQKHALREILPKQEILTVSEIKGLERGTVVLYNLLSDNKRFWHELEMAELNRKSADENSVYRYYFNLLYVGISRGRNNLFVVEREEIPYFKDFFDRRFTRVSTEEGIAELCELVSKLEVDQEELLERIEEFLRYGQYDNARFIASKLEDERLKKLHLKRTDIFEEYIQKGDYRGAGIALWAIGESKEAKKMFERAKDYELIKIVDRCEGEGKDVLDIGIAEFFPELKENPVAKKLILDTLHEDINNINAEIRSAKNKIHQLKEKKNGKK